MKIGIITEYYYSDNYGGNYQSYALCQYLNNVGYNAEQICYNTSYKLDNAHKGKESWHTMLFSRILAAIWRRTIERKKRKIVASKVKKRNDKIFKFNLSIKHSERVYNCDNISDVNLHYDCFITGSDIVWHPKHLGTPYFLNFVSKGKMKISYASSIAVDAISESEQIKFRGNLNDFKAISVREHDTIGLLKALSPVELKWVCDPVFLLNKEEWEKIIPERAIKEKYILSFYLGDSYKFRSIVSKYAHRTNLKLVQLPYLVGAYRKCDERYGDIQLFEVSPPELLSLIKYSERVFTDSFHISAMSSILKKEFYSFPRNNRNGLDSRLRSLTLLFSCQNHFCDTNIKQNDSYLAKLNMIDYSKHDLKIKELINESKKFLKNALKSMD